MRFGTCVGLLAFLAMGCGSSAGESSGNPVDPPGVGGSGGDAGKDSGDSGTPPLPGCDVSKLPSEDPCVVVESLGVFVSSSSGTANGDGSRGKPYASLTSGIAAAKASGKRVYACAETYVETVSFENGVSIFGSFDCANGWIPGTQRATVRAPASPATQAHEITLTTRVESLDLFAPDATAPGGSSIALIADASPGLRFRHVGFHAGKGQNGANGANGIQLIDSGSKNGGDGTTAGTCSGLTAQLCHTWHDAQLGGTNACTGEPGHDPGPGGTGGSGGTFHAPQMVFSWTAGTPVASRGLPVSASIQTEVGGEYGVSPAVSGADGTSGISGKSASAIGALVVIGYVPADGLAGTAGQPGQGGGGGSGVGLQQLQAAYSATYAPGAPRFTNTGDAWGAPGGGGGAGGCPGLAGKPGGGGGASIAIVAIASPFILDDATMESATGGAGGAAGTPSHPTVGGAGGVAYDHAQAGMAGGAGGEAGISGNGAGGPSFAIASSGAPPQRLATTAKVGSGGAGVAARTIGTTVIPASTDGASAETYVF